MEAQSSSVPVHQCGFTSSSLRRTSHRRLPKLAELLQIRRRCCTHRSDRFHWLRLLRFVSLSHLSCYSSHSSSFSIFRAVGCGSLVLMSSIFVFFFFFWICYFSVALLLLNHVDLQTVQVEDYYYYYYYYYYCYYYCAAYSLEEIDKKTKSFRESAKYTAAGDGGTALGVSVDYCSSFLHIQSSLLILCWILPSSMGWFVNMSLADEIIYGMWLLVIWYAAYIRYKLNIEIWVFLWGYKACLVIA